MAEAGRPKREIKMTNKVKELKVSKAVLKLRALLRKVEGFGEDAETYLADEEKATHRLRVIAGLGDVEEWLDMEEAVGDIEELGGHTDLDELVVQVQELQVKVGGIAESAEVHLRKAAQVDDSAIGGAPPQGGSVVVLPAPGAGAGGDSRSVVIVDDGNISAVAAIGGAPQGNSGVTVPTPIVGGGIEAPQPTENVDAKPSVDNSLADIMKGLAETVALSRLPVSQPSVFSGDPLVFTNWMAQFDLFVGDKPIRVEEKMHLLYQFVSGPAKEAISGLCCVPTQDSYQSAKEILRERFGHTIAIANAFRERLENWPVVGTRDSQGLRRFSDALRQCAVASKGIPDLAHLSDPYANKRLLSKLPEWLVLRWRRVVASHQGKTFPDFQQFTDFIEEEARVANDPYLLSIDTSSSVGSSAKEVDGGRGRHRQNIAISNKIDEGYKSLNTQTDWKCAYCENSAHLTRACQTLTQKGPEVCRSFVIKHNLCFKCAEAGHFSRDCEHASPICKHCQGNHLTFLHSDNRSGTFGQSKPSEDQQ